MKREVVFLILALILVGMVSFVYAVQQGNSGNVNKTQNQTQNQSNKLNQGIGQNLSQMIETRKQEIRTGNYTLNQGQLLNVREMAHNLIQLRVRNASVNTELNVTIETDENNNTKLKAKLKNGQEREIKIMPDTAAERALERLRLRVCNESNNCTIVLKDTGERNETRLAYELQVQRHYRLLGLFRAKAQNKIQISAENGEIIIVKKPWWAFLALEQED